MNIQPEGESLRKAIQWIAEERIYHSERTQSDTVAEACLKYDLTPLEADFLIRHLAAPPECEFIS